MKYNLPVAGFLEDFGEDALSLAYCLDIHLKVIFERRRTWRRDMEVGGKYWQLLT